jgi:predicted CxxxxCH...CXXCH cytochrome family protein
MGRGSRIHVGIASAGSNGCEGCHNDFIAHPYDGIREAFPWYNNGSYQHSDVNGFSPMCILCHGVNLEDGVGPTTGNCSNITCHVGSGSSEGPGTDNRLIATSVI